MEVKIQVEGNMILKKDLEKKEEVKEEKEVKENGTNDTR